MKPKPLFRRTALSLLVLALFVFFALPAFAQTTSQPPVVSVLSVPLAVIALLGLVSAYVAQGATTGSVLGLFTISPKVIPYLSVIGTFLATLVTQLGIAAAAHALTGAAVFNAVVAAFYMLVAPATGSAIRHHIDTPKVREVIAASIRPPPPPKVPGPIVTTMLAFVFVLGVGFSVSACTPATAPVWSNIENTILKDLENGVVLSAIETAVETLDPALAGIAGAVDAAIQSAITYLESVGAIPVAAAAHTTEIKTQLTAKLVLIRGGKQ